MNNFARIIENNDNVATVLCDCVAGEEIMVKSKASEYKCRCNGNIPFGHKIAVANIEKGDQIVKYGEPIGIASKNIKKGDWVHVHNVKENYTAP